MPKPKPKNVVPAGVVITPERPLRMLDYKALKEERGIHYAMSHLRRMWQADPPKFPKPYKPTARKLAWDANEIDAWLASRKRAGE
jgi:predicted DNA-binding transcriptional regulator AlpA